MPLTPADDPGAGSAPSALVARQPILDAAGQVVAYELLYRGAPGTGERATARVMHAAFGDIGLENLVGARPAYINVTAKLLLDTGELPFPPSAVVLELLEDETVSPDLLERLRELADGGYVLALDDFVFRPTAGDLLELASIVKVDIRAGGLEHMRDQAALLAGHDVTMLAEKVEDQREFEACRRMGYELFQGFYFCRPVTVAGRQSPVS
ncbi:MAG: EAL domain-containing protein [Solirubrobacterales bacterium]|nr:EAL domain-containing protein [Solirubrobacterales bacterium]